MSTAAASDRRLGFPLSLQIVALLIGGLVVAQLTTLCLSLLWPAPPAAQYRMQDIAAALHGQAVDLQDARPLVRSVQAEPPSLHSAGWLVSESSRADLSRLMGANESDVRLLFYSPLPFAGASGLAQSGGMNLARTEREAGKPLRIVQASFAIPGLRRRPPAFGQRGGPGMATIPGLPQGALGAAPAGSAPMILASGVAQGGPPTGSRRSLAPGAAGGLTIPAGGRIVVALPTSQPAVKASDFPTTALVATQAASADPQAYVASVSSAPGMAVAGVGPGALTTIRSSLTGRGADLSGPRGADDGVQVFAGGPLMPVLRASTLPHMLGYPMERAAAGRAPSMIEAAPASGSATLTPQGAEPAKAPPTRLLERPAAQVVVAPVAAPARPVAPAQPASAPVARPAADGWTIGADATRQPGLFGFGPAPFVQGDFVAAVRVAPGRWVTVQPRPELFPAWQRRVVTWFVISMSIVSILGFLFARRLASPLVQFADAAERLGRDPSGKVIRLEGPAEIGRAASAFNLMQGRLKRFIDDRTAMVGAISHDLRTPLARMRFRMERAPEALREGMIHDISQMEDMISSVLVFIRDASEPSVRERADFLSIVECVVDDAAIVGGDAVLEGGDPASVEVDTLAIQRVMTNLVDNAMKYGDVARVRLFLDGHEVVAEVADAGPGLPESELERVFLPFYRSDEARGLNKPGIGLGLAVSRSIARSHGGDVTLRNGEHGGVVAQLRLPLARQAAEPVRLPVRRPEPRFEPMPQSDAA